ncbi:hypothetical protein [Legionella norrlandica]|uniref:hypothetical protein n=1 Tax=Legionella norrlandica TaxID=1498499 RepID=UPI000ACC0600|nr:hypothetical protein [Legionella norrlandica]
MRMSEEDFARWKYVIDNALEFVPFKKFEHLNLPDEQRLELEQLFQERQGKQNIPR